MKRVYPKRSIFRVLLRLAWERGEYTWSAPLLRLLSKPVKPVDQPHAQLLTAPGCYPLPAVRVEYADGVVDVVTAWELTAEEVADVVNTGRLWLSVRGGAQPPVVLSTRCPYADDPVEVAAS